MAKSLTLTTITAIKLPLLRNKGDSVMKKYDQPKIDVIEIADVITSSGDTGISTIALGDGFDDKRAW